MKYESCFVRKNGKKWRAVLKFKEWYKDDDGNDAFKWSTVSKTLEAAGKREAKAECEAWRDEMEAEAEAEAGRKRGATVAEYVAWYIDYVRVNKKGIIPTTLTGYRTLLKHSIAPYLGDMELGDVTERRVVDWLASLQEVKSAATAAKAFVLLRGALKEAKKNGLIAENPTDDLSKPKVEKKTTHNALDELGRGRVGAFVNIDPADPVSLGIRLALYTGMREGEICGLRWRNIDMGSRTLRVVDSLGKASKDDLKRYRNVVEVYSGVYLKTPKNAGSIRTIAFPENVAQAFSARRAAMRADCMAAGVQFDESMFVVGKVDGKPMHPHNLWRRWNALVTAMGLLGTEGKTPTFHDLRHTYATTAIANHIDVKTVSNQMGHKDAAMTLNTYATVDPDAARRAADRMDDVIAANMASAAGAGEVLEFDPTGTEA